MRVTRWGEFGILCSLNLARRFGAGATGATEISEAEGIPLQYTHQILQRLRKGGIITSARGPHGGYQLAKSPDQTNLKEILLAVEGKTFDVVCDSDPVAPEGRCAQDAACGLEKVWRSLKESVDKLLEGHTLQTILEQESREQLVTLGTKDTPSTGTSLS